MDKELLDRYVLGATQNQNESFNNLIRARCPETSFCGLPTVQCAVNLAVLVLNNGMQSLHQLMQLLGKGCGPQASYFFLYRDNDWTEKESEVVFRRKRRKKKSANMAAEENTGGRHDIRCWGSFDCRIGCPPALFISKSALSEPNTSLCSTTVKKVQGK